MTVLKNIEDTKATLAIEGRIDTSTSPDVDKEVETLDGITELVFDFAKVDYISSAGLRVLLKAQKLMNTKGSMKLINVKEEVMDIFDITGFADILTIE